MSERPTRKELLLGGGHLMALWTLALAQPLLDLLGHNPEFFVARNNTPGDVLILAFGFTLVPPLLMLALEAVTLRVSERGYRLLHLFLLAATGTFLFVRLVSGTLGGPAAVVLPAAFALGLALALAVRRYRYLCNLLDLLIAAPAVVLVLFIFVFPVREVIFPAAEPVAINRDRGRDRPVVLVIFDELGTANLMTRRDSIDARRFPNFARLAREGTWYRNETTTSAFTPKAVPGILTGRVPDDDTLATAWDQPDNLFTLLARDRKLHVMEDVTSLCPLSLCPQNGIQWRQLRRLKALASDLKYVEGRLVLPPDLARRLPDVGNKFADFGGGESDSPDAEDRFRKLIVNHAQGSGSAAVYRRFIRGIPKDRRGLTVVHLALPHYPWRYTPSGREYNYRALDRVGESVNRWGVGRGGRAMVQARMYTQAAFADRLLGELRQTLRRKRLWDEAIVVIAADHGLSFGAGRRRLSGRGVGEIANPPLFIKYPAQRRGRTVTAHSTTLDILPTIARAVGVAPTYRLDGVALQDGPPPPRPIEIHGLDGPPVAIGLRKLVAERNATIAAADRELGTGPVFTLGPAPELIGTRVPGVPAGTGEARLDTPDIWDDVDPARGQIPVSVTGSLASRPPGTTVAVAVNGVIRGSATAFRYEGRTRFGTLVDPGSLKPGRNELGIYVLERGHLAPLGRNRP